MKKIYDLLILGGGVSGCVLAYSLITDGYKGKIAIIENGRKLGGRFSSRKSLKNKGWILNHGSPNFNILNTDKNQLMNEFLNKLLKNNLIISDDSDVLEINNNLETSFSNENDFYKGNVYRPKSSMTNLLKNLIDNVQMLNKIELIYSTLITEFDFANNIWNISSGEEEFQTKFIISASNLILHKRSIQILKKGDIPLRNAIPEGKNKKIDKIITLVNNMDSLKRVNYLIYPNNLYKYKKSYFKNNIHFLFNYEAEKKFGFERIVFQKQTSQNVGIVIHTRDLNYNDSFEYNIISNNILIKKFNYIFQDSNLVNKLENFKDISIMRWRASQPKGDGVPSELQICEEYKIAFCGDWFDFPGFSRVEGAILSALSLSSKINKYL